MNIDISKIVNDKIKEMEENKTIEKALEESIEATIKGAIEKALDGYTIRRTISDKIEKEVSESFSNVDFSSYNSFIVNRVQEVIENTCKQDALEKINKKISDLLIVKHTGIKLSALFEKYRDYVNSMTDECDKYEMEEFHVKFEQNDSYSSFYSCEMSAEEPSSYRKADIRFELFRPDRSKNVARIHSLYIDGEDMCKTLRIGTLSDIDSLLLNLYFNETLIELDINDTDDIDNTYEWED